MIAKSLRGEAAERGEPAALGGTIAGCRRRSLVRSAALVVLLLAAATGVAAAANGADRLERFRALAASRLAAQQLGDDSGAAETYREVYALLDDEIVENLASGEPFASLAFLQDRLDAFGDVWGSTVVRLARVGPFLVGAFQLTDAPSGNSVRVYGRLRDEVALLATFARDGRPSVHPVPAARGAAQFVIAWEGALSGRGTRALRLDEVREQPDGARVVWSTSDLFPQGLLVRGYAVRGAEIRLEYELHYPGWTPGCDGQTEQEDVYRLSPASGTFARVARRDLNAWHRDFRLSVARLFSALSTGDRRLLATLVPDRGLRDRLPATLTAEPACDAEDGPRHDRVSVAATAEDGPWQLTWERSGAGWRLVRAAPVIQ